MRLALLAILVLATCDVDPITVQPITEVTPPSVALRLYAETAECVGADTSPPEGLRWFTAEIADRGHRRLGAWEPPHKIFVDPEVWAELYHGNALARDVVRHEALHDVTGSFRHDVRPDCDPFAPEAEP